MIGVLLITALISISYIIIIIRFSIGWKRIREFMTPAGFPDVRVSIIIPFRNEDTLLGKSVSYIENLNYPATHLEIVYVNDHSSDNSLKILRPYLDGNPNFRLINLNDKSFGKKAAIIEGVKTAKGDLLLFTDADCFPVADWVKTMASFYKEKKPVMISGPVVLNEKSAFFEKFQELEFISLSGSGAGSFGIGNPVMCNGANLGYDRRIYTTEIEKIRTDVASGDDIFMLLHLKKRYPLNIFYLKSRGAVVSTEPVHNLKSFLSQRMRWVKKVRHYRDLHIITTGMIVFLINMGLVFLLIAGLFQTFIIVSFAVLFFLKSMVDLSLLWPVCSFFGRKKLLLLLIPFQLIYIFYSVFSVFAGCLLLTNWKGRNLSDG